MRFTIYDLRLTPRSSRREEALINSWLNQTAALAVQPVQLPAKARPLQRFNASTLQRIPRSFSASQRLLTSSPTGSTSAFTLIELLVVIAIAVIICALLITAGGKLVQNSNIQRAVSEREQLETAIDAYYHKYGYYPPGNALAGNTFVHGISNELYYELIGTTMTNNYQSSGNTYFAALDGSSALSTQTIMTTFGVAAFMNCTKNGNSDDTIPAQNFLGGTLKAGEIASNGVVNFIVTAANSDAGYAPMPGVYSLAGRPANPWRYVCPGTNNPNSYDLWVQVYVGNHSNLVCNWAKDPQLNVPMP